MKKNENKSTGKKFAVIIAVSFVICFLAGKTTGLGQLVTLCVTLAIPGSSESNMYSVIKSINSDSKLLFGKSDDEKSKSNDGAVTVNGLAYTPDDIKKLILQAEKSSENDKKGGSISAITYGEGSATQKYGDVLVKNTTGKKLDIGKTLKNDIDFSDAKSDEPKVLIFHTHTSECYQILERNFYSTEFSPRSENLSQNVVRVGNDIAAVLEKAGIAVLHDTAIYDAKYTGAYDRSGEGIDKYLKKYPSIQVVLDVHRDAIQYDDGTKIKPVASINGKKAAQIMIISGCEGGDITDFPDWKYNLNFALKIQKTAAEMYPGLMRPLFFCNRRYNMYKSHCSVLLEMGSDANTLDEAVYSGRLIGDVLAKLLLKYE